MKKIIINKLFIAVLIVSTIGCKKYLDINSDPDTTQQPSNSSVLPQCLAAIPTGLQSDGGLYVAKYVQNWLTNSASNANVYDLQGYNWSGGTMAATWNMTYYAMGNNLNYILENATQKGEPEYIGVALALKAWAFQHTTDYNSDIIFYDAFKSNTFTFHYDSQDVVYKGVDSICRLAITYLDQAIAKNYTGTLKLGDLVYSGDASKWKKFVYGILARNWHHLTNKSIYNADSVIKYCDNAMGSVNDDFCVPFDATINNNANYFGTFRDNMTSLRQSNFIVRLLDGTALAGNNAIVANRDPRMAYMLACSQDTTNGNGGYRGVDPGQGDPYSGVTTGTNARKRVAAAYGDSLYASPSPGVFINGSGKYLFQNKAIFPVMTYSEMQFIKAEAAFRKGYSTIALTAYRNGIQAHFDFINRNYTGIRNASNLYSTSTIPSTIVSKYLASANVKQTEASLTLTDIMLQKYIALWGWGFFETWVDMRRYHYIDTDPATSLPVYKTFSLPTPLYAPNNNKPVYRVRPHYTSEYTYNYSELQRVGAFANDYQTKEMWFSQP
ncbi:MAG: SusD/RagB family nutrient-binding outer membrane lipoprotein [Sphingobacteriia bacterium]|nr:SusD/RagB family nutrient-binding outer membrane lipoprotein [Sphingobacteriia bacterium]